MCQILLNTTITQNVKYKQIDPNNQKIIGDMAGFFFFLCTLSLILNFSKNVEIIPVKANKVT